MPDLHLPLKSVYFDQIKSGEKEWEYRLVTPFWAKRLQGRTYDNVTFTCGYPRKDDQSRRLTMPFRGVSRVTITHPHFGPEPVEVFAIRSAPY